MLINNIMSSKPKLTVYKAINKSFIVWGIKLDFVVKVYYKKELEKRKKSIVMPCVIVDYNNNMREWYINYYDINNKIFSCTVNDITGSTSIVSFE